MTMDLDERARRAGVGLRSLADERAPSMYPPTGDGTTTTRQPLVLVGATVAAVLLVVVVAGLVVNGTPAVLEIDPVGPTAPDASGDQAVGPVADDEGWLPVPAVGDVIAAYREDLTPVFITHPAAGEVLVIDAIDPHLASALDKLVAFCPSSGWFEDLYHGARFNAWGDWTGGPAPTGLPAYPIELADDGTRVRITGDLRPAPARDEPRGPDQPPVGPGCEREGQPADIVGHRPPPSPPTLAGDQIPASRWQWATLTLGGEAGDLRVCDPDGSCDPDAPPVTFTLGQPGTQIDRVPVTYLVRREPDGRVRVLHPADPTDGGYLQLTAREQPLLGVPPPGTAAAVALRDRTPVFATHTDDGAVHLLAAWSSDDPAHLLGWCPTDQSLHGPTGRYAPDGQRLDDVGGQDLATYEIAIDVIGDTRGIRITGQPDPDDDASAQAIEAPTPPSCGTDLVSHRPTDADHVYDDPDGIQLSGESWAWVRMPIQERDGELYLCSLADAVPDCGVPHPDHTSCVGDDLEETTCRALQDPVVTTPGIEPHPDRRLLLVRPIDDGDTTQVRLPRPDR